MKKAPFILLASIWTCGAAQADFTLRSAQPPGQTREPAGTASTVPTPTSSSQQAKAAADPHLASALAKRLRPPAWASADHSIARGFGAQIPLEFAVRQIVPSQLKVIYGAGADHKALVDWQGGKAWKLVLKDALRPLGLGIRLRANSVSIASSSKSQ